MTTNNNIPKHWLLKKLGEIAKWGSGGTPTSTNPNYYNGDIPWLIIGDLNDSYILDSQKKITRSGLENSSAKIVKPFSILIAMYGSIGKLGINKIPLATNQAIAFTESINENVFNKFLFYYLFHIRSKLYTLGKGGTQRNISQSVLKKVEFPLPPLPEQKAIVSKIEELFSELDKGVESLKTAQQQLKVYRQSLLKWAFEGKLTAGVSACFEKAQHKPLNARQPNRLLSEAEISDTVVERSRNHRSKVVTTASLAAEEKEKYGNGELPEGWKWIKLGDIATKITDGEHATPRRTSDGILLLSARNIQNGYLDLDDVDHIPVDEYDRIIKRCNPEHGDILISCSGSIGRVCRVPLNMNFTMVRSVALVKLDWKKNSSKFYEYLFQSPLLQRQIEKSKKATAQANLFLGPIKNLNVIVCPLEEQQLIVDELESRLTVCDKIEETITNGLQQSEALRQSILKKAFEGRLI